MTGCGWRRLTLGLTLHGALAASGALAADATVVDRRVPDAIESSGGNALGLGNAGSAAMGDLSAVRINPSLMSLERQYTVNGGYHWPTEGRDFYEAGVIDSTTSEVAAGFSMTGFTDPIEKDRLKRNRSRDTLLDKRFTLAFGRSLERLSVGINGSYIMGFEEDPAAPDGLGKLRGATLGLGIAGLITPALRAGVSVENLNNSKVAHLAPRTIRGGLAFLTLAGNLAINADYRQRERVAIEEIAVAPGPDGGIVEQKGYDDPERMLIGSFILKAYDLLRVMGSYGQSVSSDRRRSLSGGIGIVQKGFSLFYTASQPYADYDTIHTALNVSVVVTM